MTLPLKVAGIGAGFFSQFHYEAWQRLPDAELLAICDRDTSKAEAAAQTFGAQRTHDTAEALLANEAIDILDIAAPPTAHLDLIRLAAGTVPTIVCQKPFCGGLAGAEEACAIAAAAGTALVVHENFRFQPWFRACKTELEIGALGEVYEVAFRLRPGDGQGPRAYLDRQPYFQQMEHFLLHETAVHLFDVFRYLLGDVVAVFADLRRLNPAIAGEDAGLVILRFASGSRALFDGNRLADHAAENRRLTMGEMQIDGAEACLRLDGFGRLFLRAHGSNQEDEVAYEWQDRGYGGDCVHSFQAHVLRHLREGTPLETRAEDYLTNLKLVEAAYRSNESGRWEEVGKATA